MTRNERAAIRDLAKMTRVGAIVGALSAPFLGASLKHGDWALAGFFAVILLVCVGLLWVGVMGISRVTSRATTRRVSNLRSAYGANPRPRTRRRTAGHRK
jgi:hypothetical protein